MSYPIRADALLVCALIAACSPKDSGDTDTDPGTTKIPGCEKLAGPADSAVEWYLRCGGPAVEGMVDVATDQAGNIYVGAFLHAEEGAGQPYSIGEFEVTPGEFGDIFLLKFSGEGEPLWVRQFGGPGHEQIRNLVFCDDGVVIIGEAPAGTLDLGNGTLTDGRFIASFDAEGNHRWSRSIAEIGKDSIVLFNGLACDSDGTLAITGSFRIGADFGNGPMQPFDVEDGYVATFDRTGELGWVRQFNADGDVPDGRDVAFTPAGEVVVVGGFAGTIDLGGGPLTNDEDADILVAKFTADGELMWNHGLGGETSQNGMAVAVDAASRIALGGHFLEKIEIGADEYTNVFPDQDPPATGTQLDAVLALLDAVGAPLWSQHIGAMLGDDITDLAFAGGELVTAGFVDDVFTLRALAGQEKVWEWSTDQLRRPQRTDLSGRDFAIVGTRLVEPVDLGSGALVAEGEGDLLLVKLRR